MSQRRIANARYRRTQNKNKLHSTEKFKIKREQDVFKAVLKRCIDLNWLYCTPASIITKEILEEFGVKSTIKNGYASINGMFARWVCWTETDRNVLDSNSKLMQLRFGLKEEDIVLQEKEPEKHERIDKNSEENKEILKFNVHLFNRYQENQAEFWRKDIEEEFREGWNKCLKYRDLIKKGVIKECQKLFK